MAVPPWPHAAEVTETHVFCCDRVLLTTIAHRKRTDLPSTLRIHGDVIVSHGSRKIGRQANPPGGWSIHASFDNDRAPFDHRVEVTDPAVLRNYDSCRNLIYGMLDDWPVTGEYDLAPGNWGNQELPQMDFADVIGRQIDNPEGVVLRFDIDIHLPSLLVCLVYSHPQALIRACKETGAGAGALAAPGQECMICHLELEPGDEEIVRLPCFHTHAFHTPCIKRCFYRESKCPICRREVMDYFGFRF
ncbi:hypothetical protein ZWY2020_027184 [Hordeum vulgare]|nr:hypothetical protein ZWY2020_027184 [Hordeum vulgare]